MTNKKQSPILNHFLSEKIQLIKSMLAECTEKQKDLFKRMYPKGIENYSEKKIDWAIVQLENTNRGKE